MGWGQMTLLAIDPEHCHAAHERWAAKHLSDAYRADWIESQCGGCRFYVNLEGSLGSDWGACTNPASERDGTLMFEHDGCEQHEADPEPVTAEYVQFLETSAQIAAELVAEAKERMEQLV